MNNQFGMGNMQIHPTSASSTEERFTASMNNQFNMGNAFVPRPLESPFKKMDDWQLLNELRSLANFSHQTPTAHALFHEIHKRATKAFGITLTPTKEVQGEGFLYTTIVKNGEVFHFIVDEEAVKAAIENIIISTTGHSTYVLETPSDARTRLFAELGNDVFRIERVSAKGERLEPSHLCGFDQIAALQVGFEAEPQHPSRNIPVAVMLIPVQCFSYPGATISITRSIMANIEQVLEGKPLPKDSLIKTGVENHLQHLMKRAPSMAMNQIYTCIKLIYKGGLFSVTFEELTSLEEYPAEAVPLYPTSYQF